MRSVVVHESVCGNTAELAHAVADVLAALGSVELVPVGQATSSSVQGADLQVVGAYPRLGNELAVDTSDRQSIPESPSPTSDRSA